MEWEKAKNIILIFLLGLNLLLVFFIYKISLKYTLTDEEVRNITAILAKDNIEINTDLIKKAEPMKKLELSSSKYDSKEMIRAFMEEGSVPINIGDMETPIYETEKEKLIINRNVVNYTSFVRKDILIENFSQIAGLCQDYIEKMGETAKGYSLDISYETDEGWILEYRQRINGYVIYGNYIKFIADKNGIRKIDYSYSLPIGYQGEAREISAADEVLFTFSSIIGEQLEAYEKIMIDKMDMIYLEEESGDKITAIPAYRIMYTYFVGSEERQGNCVINAYNSYISMPLVK